MRPFSFASHGRSQREPGAASTGLSDRWGDGRPPKLASRYGVGCSDLAVHFIAGLKRHAAAISAVTCPSYNSYQGLVAQGELREFSWAPVLVAWGKNNRSAMLRVPGNRIGSASSMTLSQLKIAQEAITLVVFVPFAMLYMDQPFKLDFVWAGLCMIGAVYFIFRD